MRLPDRAIFIVDVSAAARRRGDLHTVFNDGSYLVTLGRVSVSLDVSALDTCAEDVSPDAYSEEPTDFLVTGDGWLESNAEAMEERNVDCLSMSAIRGVAGFDVSTMFFTPWVLRRSWSPTAATSW